MYPTNTTGTIASGGYSNVSIGKAIEAPEASKVRDAITSMEGLQNDIADVIGALERRLDTVLRPLPPSGTGSAMPKNGEVCSHVVGRLNILNEGFIGLAARLRELRDRVEV